MDLHVHADLKEEVARRAAAAGRTLNDYAAEAMCRGLGLDPGRYRLVRRAPGRKPSPRRRKGP